MTSHLPGRGPSRGSGSQPGNPTDHKTITADQRMIGRDCFLIARHYKPMSNVLQSDSQFAQYRLDVLRRVVAVDGNTDPARVSHYMDVL